MNINELLREAEQCMRNEERMSAYEAKKQVLDAQKRLQAYFDDYCDKRLAAGSGEPEWWSGIDADQEYQEKFDAS